MANFYVYMPLGCVRSKSDHFRYQRIQTSWFRVKNMWQVRLPNQLVGVHDPKHVDLEWISHHKLIWKSNLWPCCTCSTHVSWFWNHLLGCKILKKKKHLGAKGHKEVNFDLKSKSVGKINQWAVVWWFKKKQWEGVQYGKIIQGD